MSDGVETGSLVGTWVAAGVAVIALMGVLGPILVWCTIRTERHKAIDKLSQRGGDTGGYLSKGLRITSTIRLFRRFVAPNLQSAPSLSTPNLIRDGTIPLVSPNSAGWIQFGRLLESYQIQFPKTKIVDIRDSQTWLPVHRTWIIIIGLLGRYGKRKDKGRLVMKPVSGIASTQAKPGASVALASAPYLPDGYLLTRASLRNTVTNFGYDYTSLFGVTGSIHLYAGRTIVDSEELPTDIALCDSHTRSELGAIPSDKSGIGHLFWLAVGCLPAPRSKVYSLDVVESIEAQDETSKPQLTHTSTRLVSGFDHDDSDNDQDYRRRPEFAASNTCVPHNTTSLGRRDPHEARTFWLSTMNHRVGELTEVATSINADDTEQTYSLEEIKSDDKTLSQLKESSKATYMPLNLPWVRFCPVSQNQEWYFRREDAQLLAQALLDIPMSPLGYLVGGDKKSQSRTLLCAASNSLPRLLIRLKEVLRALGIVDREVAQLAKLIDSLQFRMEKMKRSRPYYEVLHDLDAALATRLHSDPRVNDAIGVLMITNEQFRELIAQSARHIEGSISTNIELDVSKSTLNIPAVMGFIQRFLVELAAMHPTLPKDDGPITIQYRQVIFAALKAAVRSTFLATSLDSLPLFRAVLEMDTIMYIGSSQQ